MLINCPECNNQISDKAIACPHCGLPMKSTPTLSRRPKYRRLPNGYGNIRKLSGQRRKPYAAYPPTIEYTTSGSAAARPAIGYYETYQDAYAALAEYNKNPYDIDKRKITFKEVFEAWQTDHFSSKSKVLSDSSRSSTNTAAKHLSIFNDKPIRSIKTQELQTYIDSIQLKRGSIENIVWVLKNVFKFALQNDWIDKDYAQFVKINQANDDEKGVPFTEEEIQKLWNVSDDKNARIVLFMIYSGFRISEIETLTFYPEDHYCKGGMKTKAGKDRTVPINDCVYDFINDIHYDVCVKEWRESRFYPLLKRLGIETSTKGTKHTPHDCRHTFSWLCDKYNVDEFSKHLIMGHTLGNDIERKTYGHRTPEELLFEVNKIKKPINIT